MVLRTRGETERWEVRQQWRRDNQDQHTAHETRHLTNACARNFLVSFYQSCVVIFTHCTPHRVAQGPDQLKSMCVCTQIIHAWSERHSSTLSSPFHPTSYSSHSLSISSSSYCPSTSTRIVATLCFRQEGDRVNWRVLLPHKAGEGTTRIHQQALLPREGDRLRGGNLLHGQRHQSGVNDFLEKQCFSLTNNVDSLVSDGGCKHCTQPTRIIRAHTWFSSLVRDLNHRIKIHNVSQNRHSSHLPQHVARALVVVSFTHEQYITFHMHSKPTFYSAIYQTFIDVLFTRRFTLCRSIDCVLQSFGWNAPAYELRAQRSHWRRQLNIGTLRSFCESQSSNWSQDFLALP